jgi:hypothetical protein
MYYHVTSSFTLGDRVELHPGMDLWMRGARYGTVTKVTSRSVHVNLDRAGTVKVDGSKLAFVS